MSSSLTKPKLLYLLYLTKGLIIVIIIIIIEKYKTVALIDRERDFNNITTALVIRIKGYLKIEYELNIKRGTIKRIEL